MLALAFSTTVENEFATCAKLKFFFAFHFPAMRAHHTLNLHKVFRCFFLFPFALKLLELRHFFQPVARQFPLKHAGGEHWAKSTQQVIHLFARALEKKLKSRCN